jgi:Flp pilus assembly protein TadG
MKNVASARKLLARWLRPLASHDGGASAVEFALVFALLMALTLGAVEFAVASSQWATAEKATQLGVRMAVTSDPVAGGLRGNDCGGAGAEPGTPCSDAAAANTFSVTCYATSATVGGAGACDNRPAGWSNAGCNNNGFCPAAFDAILARMQAVFPRIGRQNVVIEYRDNMGGARLGYAGRNGPVPLVTVRVQNMQYQFVMLGVVRGLLGATNANAVLTMPPFTATMTGEDLKSLGS